MRVAGFVTVAVAGLIGCGGGSDSDDSARVGSSAERSTPSTLPAQGKKDRKPPADTKRQADGKPRKERSATDETRELKKKKFRSIEEAVKHLSPPQRIRVIRAALAPILKNVGIAGATVTLSDDRRTLTISVPQSRACRATTSDEGRTVNSVREVLPFVHVVLLLVNGGERLSTYVASRCDRASLPRGRGGVIFEKSGFGIEETKPIQVRSSRWTLEYAQHSAYFSVFVVKGKRGNSYESEAVVSQKPGSGSKTYRGPGVFRLKVSGQGDWTVRVRERG